MSQLKNNFIRLSWMLLSGSFLVLMTSARSERPKDKDTLKDALGSHFYIGAAMNTEQIKGEDTKACQIIEQHFNAIVAENCMKSGLLQRKEGEFNFDLSDQFVAFGEQNNMWINGHTLIWHSQTPDWFFTDHEGSQVSKEVLIQRMKDHIFTVMGRYKGRVHTWDVVNEAIENDGSYRESMFYKIIGKDFIKLAFEFANEADPNAELYYNDFSMSNAAKRTGVIKMVRELQDKGIKIDGIGMQGHVGLAHPSINELEQSILAFADLDVKVMITELDVTVLPSPWRQDGGADVASSFEYKKKMNPYIQGLPETVEKAFDQRYKELFALFLEHADKIDRVTLWGVTDNDSWKNGWPIKGRTDYPLLFDRNNQAKPVVSTITALTE